MTTERMAAMEYADPRIPREDPHHDAHHLFTQEAFLAGVRWERARADLAHARDCLASGDPL